MKAAKHRPYSDPADAFLDRTEPIVGDPNCLIWTGGTTANGYGQFRINGRMVRAHRYAWEQINGPIPDGMFIDHTCWNRACCEVSHLRLATPAENQRNRAGAARNSTTGARGVSRNGKGYAAEVTHNYKKHRLGTFPSIEEAAAAATAKRLELFGEYAGK